MTVAALRAFVLAIVSGGPPWPSGWSGLQRAGKRAMKAAVAIGHPHSRASA